jgi:clan AA aspartic protease (TIGR02281 family)
MFKMNISLFGRVTAGTIVHVVRGGRRQARMRSPPHCPSGLDGGELIGRPIGGLQSLGTAVDLRLPIWLGIAGLAAAGLGGSWPAVGQVRIVVDGQVHQVPLGVVRVISHLPGGRQTFYDRPFAGRELRPDATAGNEAFLEGNTRRTLSSARTAPRRSESYTRPYPQPILYPPASILVPAIDQSPAAARGELPASQDAKPSALRILRDPATGTFITSIKINGVEVLAIIDTGAANTILSAKDATATGANRQIIDSQAMVGIGGYTRLYIARLQSLEVAGQQLGGISAGVGQQGLGYTLLGQSEITRLGRIEIDGGIMTITPGKARAAS